MKLIFFLFAYTAVLLASCHGEMKIELKPRVCSITEVKSRKGANGQLAIDADEPPETVRKIMCDVGLKEIRRSKTDHTELNGTTKPGEQKVYLVESGGGRGDSDNLVEVLSAFECATSPRVYVHIKKYEGNVDSAELSIISKDDFVPLPDLRAITAYDIRIVTDIVEAFADQIQPEGESKSLIETSTIDVDELTEQQRLQLCERAVSVVAEMGIPFIESIPPTGRNKYYVLTGGSSGLDLSTEEVGPSKERERRTRTTITEAFSCPTHTDLYVHFNADDYKDLALWIIMKENKRPPIFDVLSYQLQFVSSVDEVSPDKLKEIPSSPNKIDQFPLNFNENTDENRRQICRKSVLATLGMAVQPLEDAVPEPLSTLYRVNFGDASGSGIMRAIKCRMASPIPIYVHLNKYGIAGRITSWVIVKGEEYSEKLSPWVV